MPGAIARRRHKRTLQLLEAAQLFEFEERFSEPEVNERLSQMFDDHVFARRLMIEWGFLDRTKDGSAYWRLK